MKVTLPKGYKDNFYVSQVEQMRAAIAALKDYDEKPADILRSVARSWCDENPEHGLYGDPIAVSVVAVETFIRGDLTPDSIGDSTGRTDVSIFGFVNYWKGALRVFVNLTDYWEYGGTCPATAKAAFFPELF